MIKFHSINSSLSIVFLPILLVGCLENFKADLNIQTSPSPSPSPTQSTSDSSTNFTAPAPLPGSINPYFGTTAGGTDITITGTGFDTDSTVLFYPNGSTTSYPCVVSTTTPPTSTTIVCKTQAHAWGKNTVTVVNSDGQTGSIINGFTYVAPAPSIPKFGPITQCTPVVATWGVDTSDPTCPGGKCPIIPSAETYQGGKSLKISGLNFLSGAVVTVGSKECINSVLDLSSCPNTITCTTQAQSPGTVNVTVTNPDGQFAQFASGYTFTVPAPSGLSYSTNPALYPLGFPIPLNTPTLSTGVAGSYSISPTTLPAELSFDTSTGIISGTPSEPTPTATYTVTATSASGSSTTTATLKLGTLDLGNGSSGNFLAKKTGEIVNNYTYLRSAATASSSVLEIDSLAGNVPNANPFQAGDKVLIIQVRGSASSSNWEFNTIQNINLSGNYPKISLLTPLSNNYGAVAPTLTQVVRVPQFVDVTIPIGTSITAPSWNQTGYTNEGGIVVFMSTGTVTILGSIDANGLGFKGGAGINSGKAFRGESYTGNNTVANSTELSGGGGGGDSSGGSPSNGGNGGYGSPGNDGTVSGSGGASFGTADLSNLIFGPGGGGAGGKTCTGAAGSNGGGIIFITANKIQLNSPGKITANGSNASNVGCPEAYGGAGAGGSIYLISNMSNLYAGFVTATGGTVAGSTAGGNGRVRLLSNSVTGSTTPSAYSVGAP